MKRCTFLQYCFFIAFLVFSIAIKSQEAVSANNNSLPGVGVGVVDVDERVKLHYSEADLNKIQLLAPYKIEQLNFQYTSSFRIINQENKAVLYDTKNFDVYEYEKFRKESERVVFRLTRYGDAVELLSRNELNQVYITIREKY